MSRNYFPRADLLLIAPDAKKLRANVSNFLPNIGLSMIDYGRSADVDRFYLLCQMHRDYYKDQTGRTTRVAGFERPERRYQSRPNHNDVYMRQSITYTAERRPVVYPVTMQRSGRPPGDGLTIRLAGRTSGNTCIKYKR